MALRYKLRDTEDLRAPCGNFGTLARARRAVVAAEDLGDWPIGRLIIWDKQDKREVK